MSRPFAQLAHALTTARQAFPELATQADLAQRLGVSQQSVSRWEAGTHRPRASQLPTIAEVLKLNLADLRALAGDDEVAPVSLVRPFPVDLLAPDTFELFTADLVRMTYPEAEVRRAGASGHEQGGLDVLAVFPDGRRMGLQCKRVQQFGPANVAKAVEAYSEPADRKVLVLSRVASPQTAEALRAFAGWELWDKDDLSRMARALPIERQEKLVDIYFNGQRMALLGRPEVGPWQTPEAFFRPWASHSAALSHSWTLLGRDDETEAVLDVLAQPVTPFSLLVAPAGMGKSRVLKAVTENFPAREPATLLRMLSNTKEITHRDLDDLGPGPKVLIVDDAHDRDGLGVLFEFAADPAHQTRLLLATRPYAEQRIRSEAARYNLVDPPTIVIDRLSRAQLKPLAEEIFRHHGHPADGAADLVAAAGDSPLVVTLAARLVATRQAPLELLKDGPAFRDVVLERFARVVTGEFDRRGDDAQVRAVLEVLALVQPFHPEDPRLLELIETVRQVPIDAASRALRRLTDGGVIYRRGHQWRLMPDVLGDYVIEDSCLDAQRRLSRFAVAALEAAGDTLLRHALVNLSRLDWRLRQGDTANSELLGLVWATFDSIESEYDPRLEAIKATALYQPRQALEFIVRQVNRGRRFRAFPEILRHIGYTSDFLPDVLEVLWRLGRHDKRNLGPNPSHAIRVLTELGDYSGQKPLEYCQALLAFGLKLASDPGAWEGAYTPLDLLEPLLSLEGTNTRAHGASFSLSSYLVNYEVVEPLRRAVIDLLIDLLRHPDARVSHSAAAHLKDALGLPMGLMGRNVPESVYAILDGEFAQTLARVRSIIGDLEPLTALRVAETAGWLADHGPPRCAEAAQALIDDLPQTLELRLMATVTNAFSELYVDRYDGERWQAAYDSWYGQLAQDLRAAHPDPADRLAVLNGVLHSLARAGAKDSNAPMLFHAIVRDDAAFAQAMLEDVLASPDALTSHFANAPLAELLRRDHGLGRDYARRLFETGDLLLAASAAHGYCGEVKDADDEALMQRFLAAAEAPVVRSAIRATWLSAEHDRVRMIRLLLGAEIGLSTSLAEDIAMALDDRRAGHDGQLTSAEIEMLLAKLMPLPDLEGYWLDELLASISCREPLRLADFFMTRVEHAAADTSFKTRAVNTGVRVQTHLRFVDSEAGPEVLERVWGWLLDNQHRDYRFHHHAGELVEAMFLSHREPSDEGQPNGGKPNVALFTGFLSARLATMTAPELRLAARLLKEADHDFIFDQAPFVIDLFERCQAVDLDLVDELGRNLHGSAISGVRQGTVGKPMPRDLKDRDRCEAILAGLSRVSPAYTLYDQVRRSAQRNIEESNLEAEAFDDA